MLGYTAYHGMPAHYPHWSYGKSYEKTKTMYDHGVVGLPYELVINSNPCLAYLMRDNTLCLQILRDAARSDLVDRWRSEISGALEVWPRDLLPAVRRQVEGSLEEATVSLSSTRLRDSGWVTTHARRLVDRMAELLELGWGARLAMRNPGTDSSTAMLVAASAYAVFGGGFEHPIHDALREHGMALVDETPFAAHLAELERVPGLMELAATRGESAEERAFWAELVLDGLHQSVKLARHRPRMREAPNGAGAT